MIRRARDLVLTLTNPRQFDRRHRVGNLGDILCRSMKLSVIGMDWPQCWERLITGAEIERVVDRDDRAPEQIAELNAADVRALSR